VGLKTEDGQLRILIDLAKCDACDTCEVECRAAQPAGKNEYGALTLRELATFAVVCRRCESPACAAACAFDALERQPDGRMKRYNMRCVSCKSCALACPFGTIYPDTVPFYTTACDFCVSASGKPPPCVAGCSRGAVECREVEESPADDIYLVGEHLAVHAPKWDKENT
jgi:Fe-S-cluster-containing hydrogenase component 2